MATTQRAECGSHPTQSRTTAGWTCCSSETSRRPTSSAPFRRSIAASTYRIRRSTCCTARRCRAIRRPRCRSSSTASSRERRPRASSSSRGRCGCGCLARARARLLPRRSGGRRLARRRLAFALELVDPPLDRAQPLLQRLDAAHPPLQLVDAVACGVEDVEDPIGAGRPSKSLDCLLAGVREPLDDVPLSGPGHGRMVPAVMQARRAYALVLLILAGALLASSGEARRSPITIR